MVKLTKAQREYMQRAQKGVLAVGNKSQVRMQTNLAAEGLIVRDHYGYFVLTDIGREVLEAGQ